MFKINKRTDLLVEVSFFSSFFRSRIYSLFIIGIAFSISGNAQKIICGDIDHNGSTAAQRFTSSDSSQIYVELNNGRKIYGKSLAVIDQNLKTRIKIDDTLLNIKETRGYYANGVLYARIGGAYSTYAQRVISGKINIYWADYSNQPNQANARNSTAFTYAFVDCMYYAQKGDSAELISLTTFKHLKELVKDCPKSLSMIDKSDKEIRQAIKNNSSYLKEIISIYNSDCQ